MVKIDQKHTKETLNHKHDLNVNHSNTAFKKIRHTSKKVLAGLKSGYQTISGNKYVKATKKFASDHPCLTKVAALTLLGTACYYNPQILRYTINPVGDLFTAAWNWKRTTENLVPPDAAVTHLANTIQKKCLLGMRNPNIANPYITEGSYQYEVTKKALMLVNLTEYNKACPGELLSTACTIQPNLSGCPPVEATTILDTLKEYPLATALIGSGLLLGTYLLATSNPSEEYSESVPPNPPENPIETSNPSSVKPVDIETIPTTTPIETIPTKNDTRKREPPIKKTAQKRANSNTRSGPTKTNDQSIQQISP